MCDFVELDAYLLGSPMAVAASENEWTDWSVMVLDMYRVDSHWSHAHWAIETIPLTSAMTASATSIESTWAWYLMLTYLLPSDLSWLVGISNRQPGQYQHTISSIVHLGHLIC